MRTSLALLLLLVSAVVFADELRPAYIQFDEVASGKWQVLFKASAAARLGREGHVIVPQNCQTLNSPQVTTSEGNIYRRFELSCESTLAGQTIGLGGLENSTTDALLRIAPLAAGLITLRLTPERHQLTIPAEHNAITGNVAGTYTVLGIEHILVGFDHLLFVLALVLLLNGWRKIAWAVTAFTVAHSVTLVGTTLGYLALPQRPVEAIIALSIVFLAVEIIKTRPHEERLSERYPWLVAFAFGLLHGFGFAGALAEIGLPTDDRPLALFTFNLGVEIGQLMIVAAALFVLWLLRRAVPSSIRIIRLMPAYAIGIIATYWFLERTVLV